MKPNRILVFIVAAVLMTTAIVVVVINRTSETKYDANSPQGVVQNYLAAIYAGDTTKAASYLSASSFCTVQDLDQMGTQTKPRVLFEDSSITGHNAQVKINVELDQGSPMGNVVTESHTLRLVRFGTGWQLTGIPWPLNDCGVITK